MFVSFHQRYIAKGDKFLFNGNLALCEPNSMSVKCLCIFDDVEYLFKKYFVYFFN